ncbi:MAG: RDD family protein [Bacteroidia bacterium]
MAFDDDSIKINTTQNVVIGYEQAGVGDRMLAALLDYLFIFVYYLFVMLLLGLLANTKLLGSGWAIITIINLPVLFYDLLCEVFLQGQSFGKKIIKIKVVKLDGTQPDLGAYLLRWAFRIVDGITFLCTVELIAVVLSEKAQRLGDMAAGTTVIRLRQKVKLRDTILYRPKSDYKIVFPEIAKLSDKDIGVIKEIFDHCSRNNNYYALTKLAAKTKEKMGISSSLPDVQFIKVVLLDYSNYEFDK